MLFVMHILDSVFYKSVIIYIFKKSVIIVRVKMIKNIIILGYGWKHAQDSCKSNFRFGFKRGKVFWKVVNVVCLTFMHCLYNICLMV